ncbi:hypothetical protein MGYG_06195 [Nannizzia gypsea CBS 118893]|uniref:Uncharacterized protein n=1 Tax=Arthroderma gypseum (strain ATCC MYA-4604 / CBS 118893) TaxID=535722 RepID=E4V0Q9_ARTGP|nr:hypothetical protein MGYG_06195 [Nannizzia gypsea CBS 118893]EFR03196.1 hypothetical protein MGYG_06195 [Nannizzia gypsea CBS 118893]
MAVHSLTTRLTIFAGKTQPRRCQSPKPISPTSKSSSSPTSPSVSTPGTFSESNPNIFEVPTIKSTVESGFLYHQRLFENNVPPAEWKQFSDEMVEAFALTTSEKIAAWTVGISVGLVSAVPLLVFGAAPGYYAGKAVNAMSIETKVKDYLQEEGELVTVLKRWNSTAFKTRGIYVRLALPRKKTKEGSKFSSGTFDSFMSFGTKKKGKGKDRSQDSEGSGEIDKKEEKRLHKRYRLIIEVVGVEPKSKSWVEHDNNIPLPKGRMELSGSDSHMPVPEYTPRGTPPYRSGMHPAELEPASTSQRVELDGDSHGPSAELEGGGRVVELPAEPRTIIHELP